jgi:preprotein translocase subunit YajC
MMRLIETIAMMTPQRPGTEQDPKAGMLNMFGMFAILGVMFYFLMIRPQSKQRKEQENLLKNLKSGDKVVLSSGIYGIITNVKDKSLMVKIADNVKVEVLKSAVVTVLEKSSEGDTSSIEPKQK